MCYVLTLAHLEVVLKMWGNKRRRGKNWTFLCHHITYRCHYNHEKSTQDPLVHKLLQNPSIHIAWPLNDFAFFSFLSPVWPSPVLINLAPHRSKDEYGFFGLCGQPLRAGFELIEAWRPFYSHKKNNWNTTCQAPTAQSVISSFKQLSDVLWFSH